MVTARCQILWDNSHTILTIHLIIVSRTINKAIGINGNVFGQNELLPKINVQGLSLSLGTKIKDNYFFPQVDYSAPSKIKIHL